MRIESEPSVMIEDYRGDYLPGHDKGGERSCAHLAGKQDGCEAVEGTEKSPNPTPPRHPGRL